MIYVMNQIANELFVECLNGRLGSTGKRVVKDSHDAEQITIVSRLEDRGHALDVSLVYGNVNYGDRIPQDVREDETFDPKLIEVRFESKLDVLTVAGFASVVIDKSRLKPIKRRAA